MGQMQVFYPDIHRNNYLSESIKRELVVDSPSIEKSDLEKLTLKERKIIELIMLQKNNRQIADSFFVSEKMIEKHRTNIIEKLGLPGEKNVFLI